MQSQLIIRILGILLMIFSVTMIPPMGVAVLYKDGGGLAFFLGFLISLLTGLVLFLPRKKLRGELRIRDGFLVVVLFWAVLSLFGAIPLYLSDINNLGIADVVFESFSGLTTTGATVIVGLDDLSHSVLFYRQQLQWLGGMGIIVLAVAILPMLGIGGMQLYRAETPGPVKDSKLTPRIAGTAKALWFIYLGLTIICALSYWGAGMSMFDAISHSFSTVAIGGFSTHDQSIGWFDSSRIEMICTIFMLISGVNFSLHFASVRGLTIEPYTRDPEFKVYITIIITVSLIALLVLIFQANFEFSKAFRNAIFHTVSIATTTGFSTDNFSQWPLFLPVLLIFASFIGGCAGSTGGGMKVIRFLLLFKQGAREIKKLIHPSAIFKIRVGSSSLPESIIEAVWGFFATYVALFFIFMLILMADGLDQVTAFSAVAACMNNLGPGLGEVANNYSSLSDLSKWVLAISMLFGRLEIFTLLVLFTPDFWRS
ncbi:TrkH family potassium uptake protein [Aliikangiella coralliicola]|uniref:Trk system potassium uptake protein n=1 Tax=Aliikangiella coralliicola TaxID=2592383 RepID=A0A545UGN3_9GAMM|nr:TrkH family potassium uptake protein [Aliikangiella coralliicola]TQV88631.1 potassium transporter [Aliikangiella coralliicola]